jgi:hypothetical protein
LRKLTPTFVLMLVVSATAGRYCVVTKYNRHCNFNDANECKAEAYKQNGICETNEESKGGRFKVDLVPLWDPSQTAREAAEEASKSNSDALDAESIRRARDVETDYKEAILSERLRREQAEADAKESAHRLSIKEKEAEFSASYPDKPNPYSEELRKIASSDAEKLKAAEEQREVEKRKQAIGVSLISLAVFGGLIALMVASGGD